MSSASELPEPDVQILTSGGVRIPAHSSILARTLNTLFSPFKDFFFSFHDFHLFLILKQAMVSPVLDNIMERPVKHGSSERVIPILGVPCDAVSAFIKYLYNSMLVSFSGFHPPLIVPIIMTIANLRFEVRILYGK